MQGLCGFIVFQIMSFWPVWRWYGSRVTDGSDEPWGVFALIVAFSIAGLRGRWSTPSSRSILLSTMVVAIYAVSYAFLPFLGRGVLFVLAAALIFSPALYQRPLQLGMAGLLILSLPLIASLQFYGGFPLRFLTAYLSSQIIGLFGYDVEAHGTMLYWFGEIIAVDAPCAGIKMLWSGLLLNFGLASWFNLGFADTWIATSFTMMSVFIGNLLRASALFFIESGILESPAWAHQVVGVIAFMVVSLIVLSVHYHLNEGVRRCEG